VAGSNWPTCDIVTSNGTKGMTIQGGAMFSQRTQLDPLYKEYTVFWAASSIPSIKRATMVRMKPWCWFRWQYFYIKFPRCSSYRGYLKILWSKSPWKWLFSAQSRLLIPMQTHKRRTVEPRPQLCQTVTGQVPGWAQNSKHLTVYIDMLIYWHRVHCLLLSLTFCMTKYSHRFSVEVI
jgi:hypothetical protein